MQRQVVLLGQNFRWRHERGLIAGPDGRQHRQHGDHRLSRSHISLDQSVHGMGTCQVLPDFLQDAELCRGQAKREGHEEVRGKRRCKIIPEHPGLLFHLLAFLPEGQLQQKKILECQTAMRGATAPVQFLKIGAGPGEVDLTEGLPE